MVGDMLTAPEDPIPPNLTPMEKGDGGPPAAFCAPHHGAFLPPAGSHRSDEGHLRSGSNLNADVPDASRMKESEMSSKDVQVWNSDQQMTIPSIKSCKRKLEMSSVLYQDSTKSCDSGSHTLESPPPVKRWLIGPLIQNFKSKMASFTEIVMSPVQLFKPNVSVHQTSANAEGSGDSGDQTAWIGLQKEPLNSFLSSALVQRLRYDTTSSNGSDAEEKPATNSSESLRVSIPQVSVSPGTPSKVEEPVDGHDPLTVCRSAQKAMCIKVPRLNHLELHHTGSEVQQSPGKRFLCSPSNPLVTKSLVVLCERSEYTTSVMSPGQERKRSGQKGDEAKCVQVSARKYDGKRRKVATSVLHDEGRGEEPSSKRALRSKRRVWPANCLSPKSAYAKDSISTTPAKISEDVKSKATRQLRKTVKGKKTETLNGDQKNHADSGRSLGCPISAEPKFTRRSKSGLVKLTPAPKQQNTAAGGRGIQEYDGPGMAMSLTLKVGSGGGEVVPIVSCGIARIEAKRKERRSYESKTHPASHSYNRQPLRNEEDEHLKSDILDVKQQRRFVSLDRSRPDPDERKTSPGLATNQLKRSFSCPDIPSLQHGNDGGSESCLNHTPLLHRSPLKRPPHVQQVSPLKRERRHTVCSIEVEREFAPLCLRKEVYPNLGFSSSHASPRSPGKSLTELVSGFLSSPLAFLSKKSVRGRSDDSGYVISSGELVRSSSSPSFLRSPTSSSISNPAFITDTTCTPEESSVLSHSSVFSAVAVEVDDVVAEELNDDEKCPAALEEKALSDSEIKTNKQVERRKVSSIRIRKTLPKPQNNLTPMGLPKAVRIKKKVFSVEEIYTNKNYSKPPEGRLETIFEVPLDRRDGSLSLFGQKRMKRFVDFPELGVPRKPKRPPIGGVGVGSAQRKAAGNSVTGRTRRGVWASSREEAALLVQDFDSLLCSKLNELDCWMAVEQVAY